MKTATAQVKYNSGLMLIIPKMGNAPMLFLEWLSKFNAGENILHKVIENEDGVVKIRLNCIKEEYIDCADYINANL
jgi:hypothetical protein